MKMKKFAMGFFILFYLWLLVGCSARPGPPMQMDQKLQAEIHLRDEEYQALVECGTGQFSLAYQAPEAVKGMTFISEQGNWKISYQGLETSCTEDSLSCAIAQEMNQALQDAQTQTSFSNIIQGQIDVGEYTLKLSALGSPLSLQIPSIHLTAEFQKPAS